MIDVFVADDEADIRSALYEIIKTDPTLKFVGEASRTSDAIAQCAALLPHVVLMDIHFSAKESGIDAIRLIRRLSGNVGILAMTSFDSDDFLFAALEAGAQGFLLKSAKGEEILMAIHLIATGHHPLDSFATRRIVRRFRLHDPVPSDTAFDVLTPRERQVLSLIVEGSTNSQISKKLFLAESTVKSHVSAIFEKLNVADRVQLIVLHHKRRSPYAE